MAVLVSITTVLETAILPLYYAPNCLSNHILAFFIKLFKKIWNKTYNYLGDFMIIKYTSKELDLLARIMRAEALNEGNLGMLMVGNVVVNRAIANCLTFKNLKTITDVIYQPNQFVGTKSSLFNGTATTLEKRLAERVLRGEYYYPATNSLWFYAPTTGSNCKNTWFDQALAGRYKNHCFYKPEAGICIQLH